MVRSGISILLITNNSPASKSVHQFLLDHEPAYGVETAVSVKHTTDILAAGKFDLVLIDKINSDVPDITEYRNRLSNIPFILLLDAGDTKCIPDIYAPGVCDFLIKDDKNNYLQLLPLLIDKVIKLDQAYKEIELHKNVFDSITEIVLLVDKYGMITFANSAVEQILGYTPAEVLGDGWWNLVYPESDVKTELRNEVINRVRGLSPLATNDRELYTKDGRKIWVSWSEQLGNDGCMIAVARSITQRKLYEVELQRHRDHLDKLVSERTTEIESAYTQLRNEMNERKRIEEDLRREQQYLQILMDNMPDVIFYKDVKSRFIRTNKASLKYLGIAHPDDAIGKWDMDFFPDEIASEFYTDEQELIRSGKPLICKIDKTIMKNEGIRWCLTTKVPYHNPQGDIIGLIGISRDITDSKLMEQALHSSEENYRTIFNGSNDAIFVHDLKSFQILDANQTAIDMYGYTLDDLQQLSIEDMCAGEKPYSLQYAVNWINKAENEGPQTFQWKAKDKNNKIFWVEVNLRVLKIRDDNRFLAIVHDITERLNNEQAILEKEARLAAIFESTGAGIITINEQFIVESINPAIVNLFGFTQEEIVGKSVNCLIPESLRTKHAKYTSDCLHYGMNNILDRCIEGIGQRKDGTLFPIEIKISEIWIDNRRLFSGMIYDITERKQAEKDLNRLNRALRVLSECNSALVHDKSESYLLHDITRILVESGSYSMAWVGYAQDDERKSVLPVAHMGDTTGYLNTITISWGDDEHGRGPASTAIRTGKTVVRKSNYASEHDHAWCKSAIEHGFESTISLPLLNANKVVGALNVYSHDQDAFDDEEVKLLEELADNLTFGITAIHSEHNRYRAELALRDAEERYRGIFENAVVGMYQSTIDGKFLVVNTRMSNILGYESPEHLLSQFNGLNVDFYIDDERRSEFIDLIMEIGEVREFESEINRRDGSRIWVSENARIINDENGTPAIIEGLCVDITSRKNAEEALRDSEAKFRHFYDNSPVMMYSIDQYGRICNVNKKWLEETGYTRDEIIGRQADFLLTTQETCNNVNCNYPLFWLEGTIRNKPCRFVKKNGRIIDVLLNSDMTIDPRGNGISLSVVQDITEQKQAEQALHRRAEFERLISRISTQFITITPDKLDQGIRQVLKDIGLYADVDEAFALFYKDEEDNLIVNDYHEWHAKGVISNVKQVQDLVSKECPGLIQKLRNGEIIYITSNKVVPQCCNAKELLQLRDNQALIMMPLLVENNLVGVLGFDSTNKKRKWDKGETALLQIVGEIITNARHRKRTEETLRKNEDVARRIANSRQLLLDELDHRVRNNLASLLSLVSMMESQGTSRDKFIQATKSRLSAMVTVHDIIAGRGWQTVELDTLLRTLSEQFESGFGVSKRITLSGPSVMVVPAQAQSIGIILQELLTNSRKYGAHSTKNGSVSMKWEVNNVFDKGYNVSIIWEETGGPPTNRLDSDMNGLGMKLIKGFTRFELRGNCAFYFEDTGFKCVLDCLLDSVASRAAFEPDIKLKRTDMMNIKV